MAIIVYRDVWEILLDGRMTNDGLEHSVGALGAENLGQTFHFPADLVMRLVLNAMLPTVVCEMELYQSTL